MSSQKPKVQFSVRLPQEVIELLDEIAENTGLNITRNNVVEQACEWYVRTYRANGDRAMTKSDFEELLNFIRDQSGLPFRMAAEATKNGCASPEPGSSPARKAVRYQGKQRKSSN